MMTITSVLHISGFNRDDTEMRAALAAGWKRTDLWWERLQEQGNRFLKTGEDAAARKRFQYAWWLARFVFAKDDPRLMTSLANLAFAHRLSGHEDRAHQAYQQALSLWSGREAFLSDLAIKPRARSSLFHLRMEARHWETYEQNMKVRLGKFMDEVETCLHELAANQPPRHRLFDRWAGEKPSVFDDTRKILSACLLVASRVD